MVDSHRAAGRPVRTYTLLGPDRRPYRGVTPGTLGGNRRNRLYGRLDCRAALRAIARGGYVNNRVFFADEATAVRASYRPCAVCLPAEYAAWKARASTLEEGRMGEISDQVTKLLKRLDTAWVAFKGSFADLPDSRLIEPGVMGDWSVKDILGHVTTWEEEALKHLPLIIEGGRPPRYVAYGGVDAFNARMTEQKRGLSPAEVRRQLDETHRRLVDFVRNAPEDQLGGETRFRRRLRLDTYGHYPEHTEAIRAWREQRSAG
jgi:hypothetical protein